MQMMYATSSHKPPCDLHSLCSPPTVTLDASSEDVMPFSTSRVLLENTIEWVAYEQHTFMSQFWRLEAQDRGASRLGV